MATSSSSSSSSSSSKPGIRYDAFLNFRGEDTRKNFTDHLYYALKDAGIYTFRDDNELRRGEDISTELLQAIQKSRVSVIVFSKNYANSRWCLEELVKIMECRISLRQLVFPIFYDVDPSDVRKQTGSFGKAFAMHEERFVLKTDKGKMAVWRKALTEAANLSGWDLRNVADGNEAKFVKKIVGEIMRELSSTYLFIAVYPVGINSRVQQLNFLLNAGSNEVSIVGIYGMGGMGKTTIAKAMYNQLFHSFDEKCFLANVREISQEPNGHVRLQEQLLSDILKMNKIKISNVDRGMTMIKERLHSRRVLLIFDDVDKLDQIQAIAGSRDWFGSGSRIIVTTRDEHVLTVLGADKIYMAREMNSIEALELFSWHAFRRSHPIEDYEELSKQIMDYCGRLPLALEVIGSFLFGRSIVEWKSALEKLRRIPYDQVQKKLQISFDGLSDDIQKDIFLDISCFFIGMDKEYVVPILNGCGFFADIGLSVLTQRCLVSVNEKNKLTMHDLLRDMGREIVRVQSPNDPERRSRLWIHEEVVDMLTKNMGTEAIQGLALKLQKVNDMKVNANVFCKLRNVRLLQLNHVKLDRGCEYLSRKLIWLCWHGFPLKFLPDGLYQENLVAIDMRYSNLRQVNNSKLLWKLKFLNLSHSHFLSRTPDFSKLPHLEKLKFKDCRSLVEVHRSIGYLDRLAMVNFKDCKQLRRLPSNFWKLRSLEILSLSGCSKFDELREELGDLESLTVLFADNTSIRQVPRAIVRLKNLKDLSLCGCEGSTSVSPPSRLWSWVMSRKYPKPTNLLPESFHGLDRLTSLALRNCKLSDDAFPIDLGSLPSLTTLKLDGNSIRSLPTGLSGLSRLRTLIVDDNKRLQTIANLPINLDFLSAVNCTSLERFPEVSVASRMSLLYVGNFPKLIEAPGSNKSRSIRHNDTEGCRNISSTYMDSVRKGCIFAMVLPRNEIPNWFNYKNEGSSVWFKLPPFEGRNLNGMNVCIVCSSHLEEKETTHIDIKLNNHTKGFTKDIRKVAIILVKSREEHLWQGHISNKHLQLHSEDELELVVDCRNTMIVKQAGVYLVYQKDGTRLKAKRGLDNDDGAGPSCDDQLQAKRLRFETSQQSAEENMDVA